MKKSSWFTLVEILIVLVLVGILTTILFKSYTWVSETAFRVQQTKRVHQETLSLSQILQNFVDRNTLDYTKYVSWSLASQQGIVSDLYLSGQDGSLHLFTSGACDMTGWVFSSHAACDLVLERSGAYVVLNDSHSALLRNPVFKIFPFASADDYLQGKVPCVGQDYLHCVQTPGFWFLFDMYSSNYGPTWTNKVHLPVQLFFTK
jgi:hypothetical protein